MDELRYKEYKVWDLPVRIFHWVNVICVLALIFFGLVMLFKSELGIVSVEAKIALKQVHVIFGYAFSINLLWRIIWGGLGNRYARWRAILPNHKYANELSQYLKSQGTDKPKQYLGHNPLGRLAVMIIMVTLLTMAITGLVRAGTDIYYPPFGGLVSEYVADTGINPESLKPYDPTGTNEDKMQELKAFKGVFGTIHVYGAYFLMLLIIVHVFFVIRAEIREGGGIISAMFTGKKIFKGKVSDD